MYNMDKIEYDDFDELWNDPTLLTPEEKEEIEFNIEIAGKLIEAREQKGINQEKLAQLTGLKKQTIAKLEKMEPMSQIDTLTKVLRVLGYKLAIVPQENTDIY
ncbi:MAG: helix-turn-helix transcriptional regulator [Oscillospiraceae bacterium]|nr:helix-turn-helix transcriptional regulator [Oscillospiraceae bacterium]